MIFTSPNKPIVERTLSSPHTNKVHQHEIKMFRINNMVFRVDKLWAKLLDVFIMFWLMSRSTSKHSRIWNIPQERAWTKVNIRVSSIKHEKNLPRLRFLVFMCISSVRLLFVNISGENELERRLSYIRTKEFTSAILQEDYIVYCWSNPLNS